MNNTMTSITNNFYIMKRIIIIPMLAMAVYTVSCTKQESTHTPNNAESVISVSIEGASTTKGTSVGTSDEEGVKNLQILVFESDGSLSSYIDAGENKSVQVTTTDGKKEIWALVNVSSFKNVKTVDEVLKASTKMTDNAYGSFVMAGRIEETIKDGMSLVIPVTRITAKVMIKKITSAFASAELASKDFIIDAIYLLNVVGDTSLGSVQDDYEKPQPSIWYSKLWPDATSAVSKFIYDSVGSKLAYGASYNVTHSFYCYPNFEKSQSFDGNWSPRHTMFTVEATLGGEKTYYPIELPVLGCNKAVIIDELIITKKGSKYPYAPITDDSYTAVTQIVPWDIILRYSETI